MLGDTYRQMRHPLLHSPTRSSLNTYQVPGASGEQNRSIFVFHCWREGRLQTRRSEVVKIVKKIEGGKGIESRRVQLGFVQERFRPGRDLGEECSRPVDKWPSG